MMPVESKELFLSAVYLKAFTVFSSCVALAVVILLTSIVITRKSVYNNEFFQVIIVHSRTISRRSLQ